MKALLALLLTFASFQASAQLTSRSQPDKVKHFAAGALIAGSVQTLTYEITDNRGKAMLFGFGAGCVAATAKELYDMTGRGTPSFKDALWTGIGAGLASVTLRYTIENKSSHREVENGL